MEIESSHYECKYRQYRNKLDYLLKHAEMQHFAESNKSNLKKTWNIMNDIINRKKSQKVQERYKLSDNTITNDKGVVAENFNDFFVNNLAKRISIVKTLQCRYMGDVVQQSLYLGTVSLA